MTFFLKIIIRIICGIFIFFGLIGSIGALFLEQDENTTGALVLGLFFIAFPAFIIFLMRKKKLTAEKMSDLYASTSNLLVKKLSEKDFKKKFGKKSTLKSQKVFLLPTIIKMNVDISYSFNGMAGAWDDNKWSNRVKNYNELNRRYEAILEENKEIEKEHRFLMSQYEIAKAQYSTAKMARNKTIADSKDGNALTSYILNPLGSPPEKPKLVLEKLHPIPERPMDDFDIENMDVNDAMLNNPKFYAAADRDRLISYTVKKDGTDKIKDNFKIKFNSNFIDDIFNFNNMPNHLLDFAKNKLELIKLKEDLSIQYDEDFEKININLSDKYDYDKKIFNKDIKLSLEEKVIEMAREVSKIKGLEKKLISKTIIQVNNIKVEKFDYQLDKEHKLFPIISIEYDKTDDSETNFALIDPLTREIINLNE